MIDLLYQDFCRLWAVARADGARNPTHAHLWTALLMRRWAEIGRLATRQQRAVLEDAWHAAFRTVYGDPAPPVVPAAQIRTLVNAYKAARVRATGPGRIIVRVPPPADYRWN